MRAAAEAEMRAEVVAFEEAFLAAEAEEEAMEVDRLERKKERLYNEVMKLRHLLASEEEKAAMAEPNGWRPLLPIDVSLEVQIRMLEEQVRVLQEQVEARIPRLPHTI
jgi:chaperonin cofactor prefoldin